jgi:N-acetylglucosaminyl-diphospho-decaprenol L-rhamnosyltransferase
MTDVDTRASATTRAVIVTYCSGPFLDSLFSSIPAASTRTIPLTVVDNASTDETVEYVTQHEGIQLIRSGRNLGYGGAANLGVRGSSEDWVIIANPDVRFKPGAIDALLEAASRWPQAGVLGPQIFTPDSRIYPSARELPSLGRGIGHAVFGWWWPTNPWTAGYRREREAPRERTAGWLSGACLFVRREAFEAVGGFDESYFMYFEDTDLCERLSLAGWDVVYVPSAVVEHHGAHATSQNLALMSKAHHESAYRYLSRHYPGPARAPLRWVLKAGLGARHQLSRRVTKVVHGAQPTRRIRPTR